MKVLIVEDDLVIAESLKKQLEKREFQVVLEEGFNDVLSIFQQADPQLVLMDINLPHQNGYYWCSQIRSLSNVPLIFISSINEKMDMMMAMQMGGDDYITKPIDLDLTLAKIQALVRRSYDFKVQEKDTGLDYGGVKVDASQSNLRYMDQSCHLTHTELQIISVLFQEAESFVGREEILDYCWKNSQYIDDNTLAVNITRLRRKLRSIGLDSFIHTKKGHGYRVYKEGDKGGN